MVIDQRARMPAVDDRLVVEDQGYELVGGQVVAVSPAKEPHATRHVKLVALLEAHVANGYRVAVDMLTRASANEDFAPDASVYPAAREPRTGGRQLERLAFEIVASESLAHAGRKAASLIRRGVVMVVAIDVERARVLRWSEATGAWELLANDGVIADVSLVLPLAVSDLVSVAAADDAVARALLAKGNRVLEQALVARHADGAAQTVLGVLEARGLVPTPAERGRILAVRDATIFARWIAVVATCTSVAAMLDDV